MRAHWLPLVATAAAVRDWRNASFAEYAVGLGRPYAAPSHPEHGRRRALFEAELGRIIAQNEAFAAGRSGWWATVNALTDLSPDELRRRMGLGGRGWTAAGGVASPADAAAADAPAFVDWRVKGVVSPVKDQGACGSCWAFASTETIESHHAIRSGKLLVLSPQTYVDCALNPAHCGGTGGCAGSIPELAFNYTAAHGLPLEADLPYQGLDGVCKRYEPAVFCDGYRKLPQNDAAAVESAIAMEGPVAVNVAALGWRSYGGGIFSGGCSPDECELDHVVQAVGYAKPGGGLAKRSHEPVRDEPSGFSETAEPHPDADDVEPGRSSVGARRGTDEGGLVSLGEEGYWIIRNSWGTSWGEDGFIRLSRSNDATTYADTRPDEGVACLPYPARQRVGGESGVLFDASIPVGVRPAQ